MPARFQVERESLDHARAVLTVTGDLDVATARAFKETLLEVVEAGSRGLVVDLTETQFMDSSGVAALLSAAKRLRSANGGGDGRLVLVTTNESIEHSLEIIGLTELLPIYATRAAAIAALSDGADEFPVAPAS